MVIFDQKSSSSGYDKLCENIFTGNFWQKFLKNLNAISWLGFDLAAQQKIISEHRWGLWEDDGSGQGGGAEDFRTERDILSVWNILIGHSRMVKNDQEWGILEWKPDSKMGNILF